MIVAFEDLQGLQLEHITVCAGWFDMFHLGHLNFIGNAKKQSEKLLVVVMNDKDGKFIKGDTRPLIKEEQRLLIVDSIKYVDYTLLSKSVPSMPPPKGIKEDNKTRLLWDRYIPIIQMLKPDRIFSLEETLRWNGLGKYLASNGFSIVYSERFPDISTTDLENKLKHSV